MRRLILSLSALGLLGMVVGCHHTAGACDCEGAPKAAAAAMPGAKPEPIKAPTKVQTTSLESSEPPVAQ
jgi:hypothetical protein